MKHKLKLLILVGLLSSNISFAQHTEIFIEADRDYKTAHELFIKEKYGAAIDLFDAYAASPKGSLPLKINAAYYSAVSSFELFNPDAESKLQTFIEKYPESTKAPLAWFYLGRMYYRTKQYGKALTALEKADVYYLSGDEVAEYYFKTGYCYFSKNDQEKASKNFHEILEVESKYQTAAQYYYGHIAYTQNNFNTALEYFKKLDSSATFGPLVPYYITQMYFEQAKYNEVIKYGTDILRKSNPQNASEINRIVAESYYRAGDYKNALTYFDTYQSSVPAINRDDRYSIAYCEYKNGDYKTAASNFERVTEVNDSLGQNAYYHLADCYLKSKNKQAARNAFQFAGKNTFDASISESSQFNYAKLSYELGFQPVALNAFRNFLVNYPNSKYADESNELIAVLYLNTRNYKDALTALDNIKIKTTRSKTAYQKVAYYRGVELFNDGYLDNSISMFEKAIVNDIDQNLRALAMYWKAEALYKGNKFDAAVKQYRIFIFNPASVNTEFYELAHYNLGYAYFKNAEYNDASTWFRKYLTKKGEVSKSTFDDCLLRTGDCFYVTREFETALPYYQQAIDNQAASSDYALFQKGILQGLLGDVDGKTTTMNTLLTQYPKSKFKADGLYEKGKAQMTLGNSNEAKKLFNDLLSEFPNSVYAKKAQLNIGLICFNNNEDDDALGIFKKVVSNYPGSPEAAEALATIKSIYISNGTPDKYFEYAKTVSNVSISEGAQDSITYEAAEQQYLNQKFDEAKASMTKYLSQFSNGIFKLNATFYIAECDYRANKLNEALIGYETIVDQPKNIFSEKSLLKAGNINYKNKSYEKAIAHYVKLEQTADLRDNIIYAQTGLMRSYFKNKMYDQSILYAQKLLSSDKVSNEIIAEAHITNGRCALLTDDYNTAKKEFQLTYKQSSAVGAESRYNLALIEFKQNNFKTSQAKCFEIINEVPSYDYWIGKSFILLADNYVALKDTFQAKQTLQSIIDNFEVDPSDPEDIKALATSRFNEIDANGSKDLMKPEEPKEQETDINNAK
ncbi:MAG: tetratricopeptide repeat protein [Bacteroidota bacterium]